MATSRHPHPSPTREGPARHARRTATSADVVDTGDRAAPHRLATVVREHAVSLGARSATIYLADLQQVTLTALTDPTEEPGDHDVGDGSVTVDGSLAGRAYQHAEVVSHPPHDAVTHTTLWCPLTEGAERLGVLAVSWDGPAAGEHPAEAPSWLIGFATLVAHLVRTRSSYSDHLVSTRRAEPLEIAAEIQWALLPPLSFTCPGLSVAGVLEPAYEVAGDAIDYAVEPDVARFAVFDGMGHGLRSAQLASLTVAAYRHARRSGHSLEATSAVIDSALADGVEGESYSTGLVAELDLRSGGLSWVNAGHPEPLLFRHGQHVKTLSQGSGLPFGLALPAQPPYPVGREQLEPGDRLLLFTDGVTEARSPTGELFGVDRLVDLLSRTVADNLTPAESMRRLGRALLEHQEARLTDDATLLMVEWSPDQ